MCLEALCRHGIKVDQPTVKAPASVSLLLKAANEALGNDLELPASPWLKTVTASNPFGADEVSAYLVGLKQTEEKLRTLLSKQANQTALYDELTLQSTEGYYNTALDAVVMVLNGVAWCGYGMFPVTYFNTDADLTKWIPIWPGRDAAQYWGNLAGDAAWTVEPLFVILVPLLIESARPASSKKKQA